MYGKFCSGGQNTNSKKKEGKTNKVSTGKKKRVTAREIIYYRNGKY